MNSPGSWGLPERRCVCRERRGKGGEMLKGRKGDERNGWWVEGRERARQRGRRNREWQGKNGDEVGREREQEEPREENREEEKMVREVKMV